MPLNVLRNRWVLSSIVVSVALATFLSDAVLALGKDIVRTMLNILAERSGKAI